MNTSNYLNYYQQAYVQYTQNPNMQPRLQQTQDWLATLQALQGGPMFSGNKPLVVCGGEVKEADDLDKAQALAESLAHSKSTDAYILKPIKKVAPKRDVVTTDL